MKTEAARKPFAALAKGLDFTFADRHEAGIFRKTGQRSARKLDYIRHPVQPVRPSEEVIYFQPKEGA